MRRDVLKAWWASSRWNPTVIPNPAMRVVTNKRMNAVSVNGTNGMANTVRCTRISGAKDSPMRRARYQAGQGVNPGGAAGGAGCSTTALDMQKTPGVGVSARWAMWECARAAGRT